MGNKTGAFASKDTDRPAYSCTTAHLHCRYINSSGAVDEWSLTAFDLTVDHDQQHRRWEMTGAALSNTQQSYAMHLSYDELSRNLTMTPSNYEFAVTPAEATVMYFPSRLSLEIKFLENIDGVKDDDHYIIKGGSNLIITYWQPR